MMADQDNAARDVAEQLGVSLSTLYLDGKGRPKPRAAHLLGAAPAAATVPQSISA